MKDTVIILGESSFMDFSHLRHTLIRIPEVTEVLTLAQRHWDSLRGVKDLDLNNSFYNSDEFFFIHPEYKNFLTDLVQFGLYKRLLNQKNIIEYVFANTTSSRAYFLVLGLQNLKEFVYKHPAVRSFNKEPKVLRNLHAVHAQPKFSFFRFTACGIKNIRSSVQATEVFDEIGFLDHQPQVLNIGVGQNLKFTQSLDSNQVNCIFDSVLKDEKLKPIFETYVSLDSALSN